MWESVHKSNPMLRDLDYTHNAGFQGYIKRVKVHQHVHTHIYIHVYTHTRNNGKHVIN